MISPFDDIAAPNFNANNDETFDYIEKLLAEVDFSIKKSINVENNKAISSVNFMTRSINTREISTLLERIPAESYDIWLKVGMALQFEIGDNGLEIWRQWSMKSEKFVDGECERKWETFGRNEGQVVTMGTLHHLASLNPSCEVDTANLNYLTDSRLAIHLSKKLKEYVRWCPEMGSWLIFNGRQWTSSHPGGAYPLLRIQLKELLEAVYQLSNDDPSRTARLKETIKFESYQKQTTLLEMLKTVPEMVISANRLDKDPMRLTVLNGSINLSTGGLEPHSPEYFNSRVVDIEYVPDAPCPMFLEFLTKIFRSNHNVINYIQRFVGYCLTGQTSEQVLLFLYGKGRNGKSTLVNVLTALLGDFASTADGSIVLQRTGSDLNTLAAMAGLRGARLVKLNEINDGDRLNEAAVKNLTGQDEISCRFLHREYFTYRPSFKLLLFGNYKPNVRGRDYGVWRRIHLLNFGVTITDDECDPNLHGKLISELPGILQWALQGCLDWQKIGLSPPPEVTSAVEEYKKAEDILSNWLDESCNIGPQFSAKPQDLLSSFVMFSNWRHLSSQKFGRMLTDAGFSRSSGGDRLWHGVSTKYCNN